MADWGLYSALRGTDDWQSKRADALMNLQAAEKRQQFVTQQEQEAMKMEEYMNQYTSMMQELDVLKEDQGRVQGAEKDARQKVVAGLAKHNGDIRKYMASGGITDLNNYKTNVMNSEAYQNAKTNKQNQALWLQDRAKGNRYVKRVAVDVPGVDENGNQTTQQQMLSMEEQMALFQQGKIDKINYSGSEPIVNVSMSDFSKLIKNPLDPYNPDNYVSQSNVYNLAVSRGASDEQAMQVAENYGNMVKQGGQAWRWNAGDPYKLDYQYDSLNARIDMQNMSAEDRRAQIEAQNELARQQAYYKAQAAKNASAANKYANVFLPKIEAMADGNGIGLNSLEQNFFKQQYTTTPLGEKQRQYGGNEAISTDEALVFGVEGGRGSATLSGQSKPISLRNAEILNFGGGPNGLIKHQGKYYIDAEVAIPEDQIDEMELDMKEGSVWRNAVGNNTVPSMDGEEDAYIVRTYLPIDRHVQDQTTMNLLQKEYGLKTGNYEMMAPHYDYDYIQQRMGNIQNALIQGGMDPQQAAQFARENSGLFFDSYDYGHNMR